MTENGYNLMVEVTRFGFTQERPAMIDTVIPPEVLGLPVTGRNLAEGTLRDQWGSAPTLLVFLRHLGCIFCRSAMAELNKVRNQHSDFPPVLYVHPSSLAEGEAFFATEEPGARAISDPEHHVSRGFAIKKAKLGQILGPSALACGFQAYRAGHRQTGVQGDPWLMPGYFLVKNDRILWTQELKHIGDVPDFEAIRRLAIASAEPVAVQ